MATDETTIRPTRWPDKQSQHAAECSWRAIGRIAKCDCGATAERATAPKIDKPKLKPGKPARRPGPSIVTSMRLPEDILAWLRDQPDGIAETICQLVDAKRLTGSCNQ